MKGVSAPSISDQLPAIKSMLTLDFIKANVKLVQFTMFLKINFMSIWGQYLLGSKKGIN